MTTLKVNSTMYYIGSQSKRDKHVFADNALIVWLHELIFFRRFNYCHRIRKWHRSAWRRRLQNGVVTTLSNSTSTFEIPFSYSKCELLLQDWSESVPKLMKGSEVESHQSQWSGTRRNRDMDSEGPIGSANSHHLWSRRDNCLLTKQKVYCLTVLSILIYGRTK